MRFLFFWFLAALCVTTTVVHAQALRLADSYPDKARYAPVEVVHIKVELAGQAKGGEELSASLSDLGKVVGECSTIRLAKGSEGVLTLLCTPPPEDFHGYMVSVQLASRTGRILDRRETAIDVSSDWKRFPRYGYIAHYNPAEGTKPREWISELNRFHINGLEFYDFQYRHDQPLAGTVEHPAESWKDIAGRRIDGSIVKELIRQAHLRNMMAMAYNASYSAYDDALTRSVNSLPLQWAIWPTADGPRTAATAKRLVLQNTANWSTHSLIYMNQNDPGWQNYLFARMRDLFKVYPFDGWHVDTFGVSGGFAYNRTPVNFISGFKSFINHAHAALHKRIVFNAVSTLGQTQIARSDADFVYSELWGDHETYASILSTTEQVHYANPSKGYVIAAYLQKLPQSGPKPKGKYFNPPSVLLADAAIFATGASHIELGDGDRMLNREYFPDDLRLKVSPELHDALRHYYDFLTGYENYLRYRLTMKPCGVKVRIAGQITNPIAAPQTIWTIVRRKDHTTIIHLINLLGSNDPHWRDSMMTRPEPPILNNRSVSISIPGKVVSVGWASPDYDGGKFHTIPFTNKTVSGINKVDFKLPHLHYWSTILLEQ